MNYLVSLMILSVLASGCISQQPSAESNIVKYYQSLINNLNEDDVQVFEYQRAADAALVSPDGSTVGTSMITWVSTPHFYKKEKLIVIYFSRF